MIDEILNNEFDQSPNFFQGQFLLNDGAANPPQIKTRENATKIISDLKNIPEKYSIDDNKIGYVYFYSQYYHFFNDTLGSIASFINFDKNITLYIDVKDHHLNDNNAHSYFYKTLFDFMIKILEKNKTKYKIITDDNNFVIENFYFYDNGIVSTKKIRNINKLLNSIYKKNPPKPTKKVYISRNNSNNLFEGSRVVDESRLETYFKANNVDIVYTDTFKTIEEEIEFFKSVKLLISTTSSGLVNLIHMPNGGNVVELTTLVKVNSFPYALHNQYLSYSFVKEHVYTSVPHYRTADEIINYFENKKYLKDLLHYA